jgi:hypothetical protein
MTAATVGASTPSLRLLPAPAFDPPYDDEVANPVPIIDGTLALAFPVTASPIPLRLVPPAGGPGTETGDRSHAPADVQLPDAKAWTHRLAQAIVEVLAGARSAAQLSPFASLEVLEHLERVVGRLGGRSTNGQPVRRPTVASLRVCEPRPGVVEAAAVVATGGRRRAVALRLEGVNGRWRCTALQIG